MNNRPNKKRRFPPKNQNSKNSNNSNNPNAKNQNSKSPNAKNQNPKNSNNPNAKNKNSNNRNLKTVQIDYSKYVPKEPVLYKVIFFDTFVEAKESKSKILEASQDCHQLNLVIQAEGDMTDTELLDIAPAVKLFAGTAWFTIHTLRNDEGWYDSKH